jgi:hypothetical protein
MVRAIWAVRGAHQRRTSGDVLARLDAEHSARLASFGFQRRRPVSND